MARHNRKIKPSLLLDAVGKRPVVWSGTIFGEPASKSNSRRLVWGRGRPKIIKSAKALSYADAFPLQVKKLPKLLEGELAIWMVIHYASHRPDLDESLILDCLQGLVYKNDRQVRERHIFHAIDKTNPRAEIVVCKRGE